MKESPIPIQEIDTTFNEGITMLCYGSAGTGKTEFCGSIGEKGIVLEVGGGDLTLKSPGFRSRYKTIPKIAYISEEIDPKTKLFIKAEAWHKITDFCDWFLEQDQFETLAIDDATALNTFARNLGMETNEQLNIGATLQKSRRLKFPVPEVADYGKEVNILVWFLTNYMPAFKTQKKNFILTAHERHIYAKQDKIGAEPIITRILPAFTGKTLPDTIPQFFDFIWRFEVANGTVFRCKTIANQNYEAKTRWSGVFPEEIKNPDFLSVLHTMKSGTTRYEKLNK